MVRRLVNPMLYGTPTMAMVHFGCANRPFYHICILPDKSLGRPNIPGKGPAAILEQLGTFDPIPNKRNEKLVSLNIERIKYWMGERKVPVSVSALELFGLAGLLPLHPKTFIRAAESRERLIRVANKRKEKEENERIEKEEETAAELATEPTASEEVVKAERGETGVASEQADSNGVVPG